MTPSPRLGHPDYSILHKNQGRRFPGGFWLLPLGRGACKPSKGWGLGGDGRRAPGGGLLVQRGKQSCNMEKPARRSNSNSTTEGLDREVTRPGAALARPARGGPLAAPGQVPTPVMRTPPRPEPLPQTRRLCCHLPALWGLGLGDVPGKGAGGPAPSLTSSLQRTPHTCGHALLGRGKRCPG